MMLTKAGRWIIREIIIVTGIYQKKISAHDYFIQNPSLSGTGQDLNKNKPEEIMLFDY